ncbi:MAG: lipoprotein-releasing ABC transporter ATP-binding protein LolD [Cellvibrionaceae bacterium]|nr:lipoprotein-releasing ABC transporter ATP-binding protein LolD [Cellvibrionaceae bacterium]
MSLSPVLSCRNVCKSYDEGPQAVAVLEKIDLQVQQGERVAIIGSSGAGKSTLLNLLGGLDTPTVGEVVVAGQSLTALSENARGKLRNSQLGFVYQFHHLLGEFSALENVAMPLLIGRQTRQAATAAASAMLVRVGLGERLYHKPSELSGGERQRVAIARAMVAHPACVLMDEPTGNLDQATAQSIQTLMNELNQAFGLSFVIVTHDQQLAQTMDRVLELKQGYLRERDIPL